MGDATTPKDSGASPKESEAAARVTPEKHIYPEDMSDSSSHDFSQKSGRSRRSTKKKIKRKKTKKVVLTSGLAQRFASAIRKKLLIMDKEKAKKQNTLAVETKSLFK